MRHASSALRLQSSSRKPTPRSSTEEVRPLLDIASKLIPILGALAAAVWTLWLYISFVETQEKYKTEQLRLANEQQSLLNAQTLALSQTEIRTKEVTLKQQETALKQSELLASTERERSRISLEQQRLSLEQQRLALQQSSAVAASEIRKQELAVQLADLDSRLKSSELRLKEQGRISGEVKLVVECDEASNGYLGYFKVGIQNTSSINVEVSAVVTQKYIGMIEAEPLSSTHRSTDNSDVISINSPPILYANIFSPGRISWLPKGRYSAHAFPGSASADKIRKSKPLHFQSGGGGTKILRPGDRSEIEDSFIVRALPGRWIAVVHTIVLDSNTRGDGVLHYMKWDRLPVCPKIELSKPATRSGIGTPQ